MQSGVIASSSFPACVCVCVCVYGREHDCISYMQRNGISNVFNYHKHCLPLQSVSKKNQKCLELYTLLQVFLEFVSASVWLKENSLPYCWRSLGRNRTGDLHPLCYVPACWDTFNSPTWPQLNWILNLNVSSSRHCFMRCDKMVANWWILKKTGRENVTKWHRDHRGSTDYFQTGLCVCFGWRRM